VILRFLASKNVMAGLVSAIDAFDSLALA